MAARPLVEAVLSVGPGEAVTRLVMGLALERTGGQPVAPRVTASGTRLPLPRRPLQGSGEVIVTVRDETTRVRIEGDPPPWPLSIGWERREIAKLLGPAIVRWETPSSAG